MLVKLVIGSTFFSGLAVGLVPTPSTSDATITPGPQIERLPLELRQNGDRYMGWVSESGHWSVESCDLGATYYQTASYWQCCATSSVGCAATDIPIGCISGSLIYRIPVTGGTRTNSLITWPCTSAFTASQYRSYTICNTVFMYENDADTNPRTNVNCGNQNLIWSYYRNQPAAAMTPSTTTKTSSTPQSTPASSTASSTSNPLPTRLPSPDPEPEKSKAWIAGAVVGPVLGLALIGLIAFCLIRRKKKHQAHTQPQTHQGPPASNTTYPQQTYPPGPNSPPQYYNPPMQQNAGAVPFGVAKHDNWDGAQSPHTQGAMSPNPGYNSPQQWQGQNNLNINQAPHSAYADSNPSMSPQPGHTQPAQYGTGMYKHTAETVRPFSSELEGSTTHGQPQLVSEQPKH